MLDYVRQVIRSKREDGASAVEYGLLVAAIAALIVVIVFALGGIIKDVFQKTCDEISAGAQTGDCSGGGGDGGGDGGTG